MRYLGIVLWMNLLVALATDMAFFTFFLVVEVAVCVWLFIVYCNAKRKQKKEGHQ